MKIVEVVNILLGTNDDRHRRYVEAKATFRSETYLKEESIDSQHATNSRNGSQKVNIVNFGKGYSTHLAS